MRATCNTAGCAQCGLQGRKASIRDVGQSDRRPVVDLVDRRRLVDLADRRRLVDLVDHRQAGRADRSDLVL
jgi:hypothetical protein